MLLTQHERNLLAMKEREEIRAAVPGKLAELAKEMEADLMAKFRVIRLDHLWEFNEWLQGWLRKRFPDVDDVPRFEVSVDGLHRIQFEGLKERMLATMTEQELAAHTMRNLQARTE